ncbi:MAG: hypothetical protein GY696_07695, partial [Gammaproteobacteria bacterium]|nr:hypothetical protein [Gammaproteobacteria bacterium]
MVFVEESSRYKCVFGLRTKDEAYKQLQTYKEGMLLKGVNVECIRGDGAGELGRSAKFRQALNDLSLKWESSPPYTHQQQGLVERAIRQIVEGGRAQLARAYLGEEYWVWACRDFAFKANCLPHQALGGDSPYERLHPGRKPRYQALRKFGQTAYVHIDKSRKGDFSRGRLNKMRPRSERGILVGHDMGTAAYVVHLPRLKRVVTSSAVAFDDIPTERSFMTGRPEHWTSPAPGIDDAASDVAEELATETTHGCTSEDRIRHSAFDGRDIPRPNTIAPKDEQSPVTVEGKVSTPEINRGMVVRAEPDQLETMFMDEDITDDPSASTEGNNFAFCMLADTGISVQEVLVGSDAEKWKAAIEAEDQGLKNMKVITKEKCPTGTKPLQTKYVLNKKRDPNGLGERYKARRVVQGFHQVYGRDFFDTFAPVVGFDTIRVILKLAINHGWGLRSMDFTQAYLNAPLKEKIYVKNLDGSTGKLNKALYGLKQAGNEWNNILVKHTLRRKYWKVSENDSCLLFARNGQKIAMLAIYVDDLLLTGSWEEEIKCMQDHLLERFNGKAELEPRTFLKLELDRNGGDLYLHQTDYCKSIVEMVYRCPTRPVYVPLDKGADLTSRKEDEDKLDVEKYPFRQVMGKLMYLSHMSRPDISNSVRELGHQMHDPCMRHWRGLQHLLRYLATFPKEGIHFEHEEKSQGYQMKGYSDADFAGDVETRRSCAGYVLFLGETPISWSSKTEKSIV